MRLSVVLLPLICAGCTTVNSGIYGQYDGPGGATLRLADKHYEFCNGRCSGGLLEVRPSGKRTGRVTFYGVPVAAYFRGAQGGPNASLRTWGEGVETRYRVTPSGGVSIEIDARHGAYFKRRG